MRWPYFHGPISAQVLNKLLRRCLAPWPFAHVPLRWGGQPHTIDPQLHELVAGVLDAGSEHGPKWALVQNLVDQAQGRACNAYTTHIRQLQQRAMGVSTCE